MLVPLWRVEPLRQLPPHVDLQHATLPHFLTRRSEAARLQADLRQAQQQLEVLEQQAAAAAEAHAASAAAGAEALQAVVLERDQACGAAGMKGRGRCATGIATSNASPPHHRHVH